MFKRDHFGLDVNAGGNRRQLQSHVQRGRRIHQQLHALLRRNRESRFFNRHHIRPRRDLQKLIGAGGVGDDAPLKTGLIVL